MKRFVNPFFPRTALRRAILKTWSGTACKPDPALSRHPSPGEISPGLSLRRAAPTSPGPRRPSGAIWLARTGGLPGRSLRRAFGSPRDTAGGLLPHPFTHHLCRKGVAFRPSAGLLSAALDVTASLHRPNGLPPSPGLLARAASSTSPDFALCPRARISQRHGTQRRAGQPRTTH